MQNILVPYIRQNFRNSLIPKSSQNISLNDLYSPYDMDPTIYRPLEIWILYSSSGRRRDKKFTDCVDSFCDRSSNRMDLG